MPAPDSRGQNRPRSAGVRICRESRGRRSGRSWRGSRRVRGMRMVGQLRSYSEVVDDCRPPAASVAAMKQFVAGVPGTSAVLEEHLDDNDGQMLPHVLMAELSRWFVAVVAAGDEPLIVAFLAAVELLYTSQDEDARNVAEVSFGEYLVVSLGPNERAAVAAANRRGGPATVRDFAAMNA